jgi:hypothetical protein
MITQTVIPKDRKLHQSEDYNFLREEGVKYVEQLASAIWTDYNTHDPGITILEALCYAITDLGYRTKFPVKDLLARPGDNFAESIPPIFTARDILTCNPWTETDWRKLLVDIEGIHNAWLVVCDRQEVDFYADCKKSELTYYGKKHKLKEKKLLPGKPENATPTQKTGIVKKWLDGEGKPEADKIKLNWLLEFPDPMQSGLLRRQEVRFTLPGWKAVDQRLTEFLPFLNHDVWEKVTFSNTVFSTKSNIWQGDITVHFQLEKTGQHSIVFKNVLVENVNEELVKTALETALAANAADHVFRRYHQHLLQTLARLTEHDIQLRGLYDVLLEFEVDDRFGDLNSPLVPYRLFIPVQEAIAGNTDKLEEIRLDILFPSWQSVYDDLAVWHPFLQAPNIESVAYENDFGLIENTWRTDLVLTYAGQNGLPDIRLKNVAFKGIKNAGQLAAVKENIGLLTEGSILGFLHGKWKKTLAIVEEVALRLHDHRNLCEDFKHIANVGVNEVAICADIRVRADANLEKVLAQVFFEVENYLTPPVRFYTLKQMVEMGRPAEQIFDGPALRHGFIISEEIEKTSLRTPRIVYASDIVNIIMDVPGVLAVNDLLLTKYDAHGNAVMPSERWCLHIDPRHKAQLNRRKSKILFFKDQLPYVVQNERFDKMEKEVARLHALADRSKLLQAENDFPLPQGEVIGVEEYYPLRDLFPQTYGIGDGDLPDSAPAARKGQAKQLQAYLVFFDQLLANYLSQLYHLRDLFSCDEPTLASEVRTYYAQFLSTEKTGADLWADAAALEDTGGLSGPGSLQRLVETEATYLDRRNRFLDHLLARFAEQFTDYALLMETAAGLQDPAALILDKVTFLKNYPIVSSQRGKGFNYKNEAALWDTANVPGLQKRVASLLGMENSNRRFLYCKTLRDQFLTDDLGGGLYSFHLEDEGLALLTGTKVIASEGEVFYATESLMEMMHDLANYLAVEEGGQFVFKIGEVETVIQPDPVTGDPVETKVLPDPLAESTTVFATKVEAEWAAGLLRSKISADALCHDLYARFETDAAFALTFKDEQGNALVLGQKNYASAGHAYYGRESLFSKMSHPNCYLVEETAGQFFFKIGQVEIVPVTDPVTNQITEVATMTDEEGRSAAAYPDRPAAEEAARSLRALFSGMCHCEAEGFHLVEHILLRPKHEFNDHFMEVCLDENCKLCGDEDPYSFRATAVLPFWMERFLDEKMKIRDYVERLLRLEAPAHVHLKICWVNNRQMRLFETRYKRWLEENAKLFPDPAVLSLRLNDLLDIMGRLRNVYFQGFLHDCDDSEQERTIILNNSYLGTFDPGEDD